MPVCNRPTPSRPAVIQEDAESPCAFSDGTEAFVFLGLLTFGFRNSLLDRFCPLAIRVSNSLIQAIRPRAPINAPCFANAARSRCCASWCPTEAEASSVSQFIGGRLQAAGSRRGLRVPAPASPIVTMRGARRRFLLR